MRKMTDSEFTAEKHTLRIGIRDPGYPMWSYENTAVRMAGIETGWTEIIERINYSNAPARGKPGPNLSEDIRKMGQMLCDEFLTPDIQMRLLTTKARYLTLEIDADLVHIPWELLYLHGEFLCRRFSMGRMSGTHQKALHFEKRSLDPPLDMWILSNPGGDLDAADSEGENICEYMDRKNLDDERVFAELNTEILADEIRERIRQYDLVHFAGHAVYNPQHPGQSGWELTEGRFTARDIDDIAGGKAMPAFVFSNACQSARTDRWEDSGESAGDASFDLANAFMRAGVRHYLGTSWEVKDAPSRSFACLFYEHLLSGKTVGEAVRLARIRLGEKDRTGEDTSWASYILYGDPCLSYFGPNETEQRIELKISSLGVVVRPEPGLEKKPPAINRRTALWIAGLATAGLLLNVIPDILFPPSPDLPKILRLLELFEQAVDEASELSFKNSEHEKDTVLKHSVNLLLRIQNAFAAHTAPPPPSDEWSSQRVTMAVLHHNLDKPGESLGAFGVQKTIHEKYPRIRLMNRRSLDQIKKEIELSEGKWVRLKNKLNPDLWAVKLFLFLEQNSFEMIMHLTETETSENIGFFHVSLESDKSPYLQRDRLSAKLLEMLRERYPLRGRISKITDESVILDIGANVGVQPGQRFQATDRDVILEIESVRRDGTSSASVQKGKPDLEIGLKVEIMDTFVS